MKTINQNAVKIRRLASSDIEPALSIWWAKIPEKEKIAQELAGPLDMSFIAEYEGILVGFILAKLEYTGHPMIAAATIYLVAVHPEYRKHGIGTMMIRALEKLCISDKIETIRAPIPENDKAVTGYFKNAGFHPSRIINYDRVDFTGE